MSSGSFGHFASSAGSPPSWLFFPSELLYDPCLFSFARVFHVHPQYYHTLGCSLRFFSPSLFAPFVPLPILCAYWPLRLFLLTRLFIVPPPSIFHPVPNVKYPPFFLYPLPIFERPFNMAGLIRLLFSDHQNQRGSHAPLPTRLWALIHCVSSNKLIPPCKFVARPHLPDMPPSFLRIVLQSLLGLPLGHLFARESSCLCPCALKLDFFLFF